MDGCRRAALAQHRDRRTECVLEMECAPLGRFEPLSPSVEESPRRWRSDAPSLGKAVEPFDVLPVPRLSASRERELSFMERPGTAVTWLGGERKGHFAQHWHFLGATDFISPNN